MRSMRLESQDRWHLRCDVRELGRDLVCALTGGAAHVGSVALAEWVEGRVRTEALQAEGHRERELALHTAHRLARAARRNVACVAGIHFDGLSSAEVEEVVESANRLTRRAGRALEQERLRAGSRSSGLLQSIRRGTAELLTELEAFSALPIESALAAAPRSSAMPELFAPLYLSNACSNDCEYCGFRRSVRFSRTTLSLDEALRQTAALVSDGHEIVELVTGEVPTPAFVAHIAAICARIHREHPGLRIGLNVGSLSTEGYRALAEAGASECMVYQETYDPELYLRVHRQGPKRDMAERLLAPHRAAEAGFARIGLGALLGLGPWTFEVAAMIRHAEILLEERPGTELLFSLPRLRPRAAGEALAGWPLVGDDDFLRAFLYLRGRFPEAGFVLSSREAAGLRNRMLELGVTRLSAGACTAPGGYGDGIHGSMPQFLTSDTRSREQILRELGLRFGVEGVRPAP